MSKDADRDIFCVSGMKNAHIITQKCYLGTPEYKAHPLKLGSLKKVLPNKSGIGDVTVDELNLMDACKHKAKCHNMGEWKMFSESAIHKKVKLIRTS